MCVKIEILYQKWRKHFQLTFFVCVYVCMYAWEVFREGLVICYIIKSKQNTEYGLLHFPWSWLVSYRTFSVSSLYAAWKLIWYTGLKTNIKYLFANILHLLEHCWNHFGAGGRKTQLFTTKEPPTVISVKSFFP